jgi:hypothetical protein
MVFIAQPTSGISATARIPAKGATNGRSNYLQQVRTELRLIQRSQRAREKLPGKIQIGFVSLLTIHSIHNQAALRGRFFSLE